MVSPLALCALEPNRMYLPTSVDVSKYVVPVLPEMAVQVDGTAAVTTAADTVQRYHWLVFVIPEPVNVAAVPVRTLAFFAVPVILASTVLTAFATARVTVMVYVLVAPLAAVTTTGMLVVVPAAPSATALATALVAAEPLTVRLAPAFDFVAVTFTLATVVATDAVYVVRAAEKAGLKVAPEMERPLKSAFVDRGIAGVVPPLMPTLSM